jgi:Ca2+ transporting ATPase
VVTLTSVNDYLKDKQFVNLQSSVKNENITVIRGKHGATQSINVYLLVVGDIILLETGARIPADCLLVEGADIRVDEKIYSGGDQLNVVRKNVATPENLSDNPDPFLLADTLITSGSGKAVVCVVGKKSRRGAHEPPLDTSTKTPLQKKLENLGGIFTKWGLYAAIAILIASAVNFVIKTSTISDYQTAEKIIPAIVELFTIPIAIIIVAVPEGLPLSITLALAYSVSRMERDGVLVRDLESPERMGRVDEIVTGKTATLTSNEMKVDQFYVQSLLIRNTRKNTLFNCELFANVIEIVQESILFNCEARI